MKSNIFIDLPITLRRVIYTSISVAWYFLQLTSVVLLGFALFRLGKRTEKKEKIFHRYIYRLYSYDMKIFPGIHFRIRNEVDETFERACIIISNHQSLLDSMCMILLNPKILIVTNDHVWNNRIIHAVLGFANYYPISRGLENGLAFFKERIAAGYSIVIFPEGERSQDCSILRFHRGAFYVAEQLQCDILPVFIHGVGHVMPKGSALLNKGEIFIEIQKRIPYGSVSYGANYADKSKLVRHYYMEYDRMLCREIENAAYFSNAVIELYRRIGFRTSQKIKKLLDENVNFSYLVDALYEETTIFVKNDEYGVIGLLLALVHPELLIYSSDDIGLLKRLCRVCNHLPKNLKLGFVTDSSMPTVFIDGNQVRN